MDSTIKKVKINTVKPNDLNPRTINKKKFEQLIGSIKEFPDMLKLRPIVVDSDMVILGGNMRYKACREIGLKEVYIIQAENLTDKQAKEFIIKDNVSSGQWEWDILANDWESNKLNEWGLGVWENKEDVETDFKPLMFPTQSNNEVTGNDIRKAQDKMGDTFSKGTERRFVETMCPECGHEFNVEKE